MRVTETLLAQLCLADGTPTANGGITGIAISPLYLVASESGAWGLGFALGWRVDQGTLTELRGECVAQPDGGYLDANVRRRYLVPKDGWAVCADLPDLPPPPPPP